MDNHHIDPTAQNPTDTAPAVVRALFLNVCSLQATGRIEEEVGAGALSSPSQHFRHTRRRLADQHQAADDDEESPSKAFVDERVERARRRRAKYLQAKVKRQSTFQPSPARMDQLEAQEQQRTVQVSEMTTTKLELAAQRRELIQKQRSDAHVAAERVRTARLTQARSRRVASLIKYASKAAPILTYFREHGLSLQGARTTTEVQEILMRDPFAPCPLCSSSSNTHHEGGGEVSSTLTTSVICPVSKKRHPKLLVALSENFLRETSDIRSLLHTDRALKRCADQVLVRLLEDPTPSSTSPHSDESDTASAANTPVKPSTTPTTADPIGLPHFLPLAFYEACGFRRNADETKRFAARNVVLQLEEIHGSCMCILQDLYHLQRSSQSSFSARPSAESAVFDCTEEEEAIDALLAEVAESTASLALSAKSDHLRHSVSRFVKSWLQFSQAMRTDQHADTKAKSEASKRKLGQQMVASYIQLTVTQYWREEDVQRRQGLINSSDCPTPLKHRETWVAERRAELTSAIERQMRELHRAIEQAGHLTELEEQLAQVQYSHSSSCTTRGSGGSGCRKIPPQHLDDTTSGTASASCGLSCDPQGGDGSCTSRMMEAHGCVAVVKTGPTLQQPNPRIPHVNSADWCEESDLCSSETDSPSLPCGAVNPMMKLTSPTRPKPKKVSAKSSAGFRAQLAADRMQRRLRYKLDKQQTDSLTAGNDGDADEET